MFTTSHSINLRIRIWFTFQYYWNQGAYLLVLVCVVLTVLLGDGGPADGAHVVHGVGPAHQPRLPAQPRPGPVPVEQHARLLVVVHAGPGIEPGAVTSGVREQTSAQVTCGSAIKRLSQHSGDWRPEAGSNCIPRLASTQIRITMALLGAFLLS